MFQSKFSKETLVCSITCMYSVLLKDGIIKPEEYQNTMKAMMDILEVSMDEQARLADEIDREIMIIMEELFKKYEKTARNVGSINIKQKDKKTDIYG